MRVAWPATKLTFNLEGVKKISVDKDQPGSRFDEKRQGCRIVLEFDDAGTPLTDFLPGGKALHEGVAAQLRELCETEDRPAGPVHGGAS